MCEWNVEYYVYLWRMDMFHREMLASLDEKFKIQVQDGF
jgi:hypothetical protein